MADTPTPAPMTAEDEHQEFSAVMKWLRTLPPQGMIAELIINRKIDALTARVAELERQVVDWTVRTGRQVERVDKAEAELAAARKEPARDV